MGQLCILNFFLGKAVRSEEHTSELQSRRDLVCRLLLETKRRLLVSRQPGLETKLSPASYEDADPAGRHLSVIRGGRADAPKPEPGSRFFLNYPRPPASYLPSPSAAFCS